MRIAAECLYVSGSSFALSLRFSSPEEAGEIFSLSLFLCSDTYTGVDQEVSLTFKTH